MARMAGTVLWLLAAGLAPSQAFATNVYATADLSEARPYVQQNTVYTVRVYTDRTLKTADVSLPQVSGGIFTKLDDAWEARAVKGQQGTYVNERRYLFTPMRAGRIEIPPASVSVTTAGGGQQPAAAQRSTLGPAARPAGAFRPTRHSAVGAASWRSGSYWPTLCPAAGGTAVLRPAAIRLSRLRAAADGAAGWGAVREYRADDIGVKRRGDGVGR